MGNPPRKRIATPWASLTRCGAKPSLRPMPEERGKVDVRRGGLWIVAAAILVHGLLLGVVVWRSGAVDGFAFASLDATEYYTLADNILTNAVFSCRSEPPLTPDVWRTPGYPLALAAIMGVVGKPPAALVIAQQILSIVNVWLLFVIARSQMSERRAWVVALLYLIAPYRLFYTTWLLATTVFSSAMLTSWVLWRRWQAKPTIPRAAAVGVLVGLSVLIRPIAMLIPFALVVGVWLVGRRPVDSGSVVVKPRGRWRPALVLACACGAVVSGWVVRNRVVAGHWGLSSQGGVVLAYFKATEVELWRLGRSGDRYRETSLNPDRQDEPHLVWDDIDRRLQVRFSDLPPEVRRTLTWRRLAQGNLSGHDPFAVSQALSHIGWEMLLARPFATAAFCLGRALEALTFPLHLAFESGVTTSQRLRYACVGGVYAVLALFVVVRLFRRGIGRGDLFFPIAGALCLLLATAPQLDPRFRVPMMPFLLVLALLPLRRDDRPPTRRET